MRLELNVFERLLLRNIMPRIQGWNFVHMKEAHQLLGEMFESEEEKRLQIKLDEDGKQVTWKVKDDEGNDIPQTREIEISEGLAKKIAEFLEQLDRENRLGFEHMTLFEKFNKEPAP